MINTEDGKQYGIIHIPYHYDGTRQETIIAYLLIVPVSIEKMTYNWEIIGASSFFDPLKDMETVPLYSLRITWLSDTSIRDIDITRSG